MIIPNMIFPWIKFRIREYLGINKLKRDLEKEQEGIEAIYNILADKNERLSLRIEQLEKR